MILEGTVQTFVCTHPAAIILPLFLFIFFSVTASTLTTLPTPLSPPHTWVCTTIFSSIAPDVPWVIVLALNLYCLSVTITETASTDTYNVSQSFLGNINTLGQFFRWKNWCIEKVSTFLKNPLVWHCSSSSTWDQTYLFENRVYILRDSATSSLFLEPFPEATSECLLIRGNYQVAMINW